jgi:hypothetical protein
MDESPKSTNAPALEGIGEPPVLPTDVALQIADLARVVDPDSFCIGVRDLVKRVSKQDWRSELPRPSEALKKAAKAARTLDQAFGSLNKAERAWVKKLLEQEPWSPEFLMGLVPGDEPLPELPSTVWRLARLFSLAAGEAVMGLPGTNSLSDAPGRGRGMVNDVMFQHLVFSLLSCAADAGGGLSLNKNKDSKDSKDGTLSDALNILRPHLPKGVVPNVLPLGTLQTIKTQHSKIRRPIAQVIEKHAHTRASRKFVQPLDHK